LRAIFSASIFDYPDLYPMNWVVVQVKTINWGIPMHGEHKLTLSLQYLIFVNGILSSMEHLFKSLSVITCKQQLIFLKADLQTNLHSNHYFGWPLKKLPNIFQPFWNGFLELSKIGVGSCKRCTYVYFFWLYFQW
jgi:hypothetical protein